MLSRTAGSRNGSAAAFAVANPMKRVTEADTSGRITKSMNASAPAALGESAGITMLSM